MNILPIKLTQKESEYLKSLQRLQQEIVKQFVLPPHIFGDELQADTPLIVDEK